MAARKILMITIIGLAALLVVSQLAAGAVVEYKFDVGETIIRRLCNDTKIVAVNGTLPGPTIYANKSDTVVIHVSNNSPYNISIHWHGIFQKGSQWADGAYMITQCAIAPGGNYTYRYTVAEQEGTLWWHAHTSMLRATVYGALLIYPRNRRYPFPVPDDQLLLLLGEWWNGNVVDIEKEAEARKTLPTQSDALTINGLPGNSCNGTSTEIFVAEVAANKTYLLRIINAAVNTELFFKIDAHNLTVVAADACYVEPYNTDVIVLAPGQTVDALLVTNATPDLYYMASVAFVDGNLPPYNKTATAVIKYSSAPANSTQPAKPTMPSFNVDNATANSFFMGLQGLAKKQPPVPTPVNRHLSMVVGLGNNMSPFVASFNAAPFMFPTNVSLLQALFAGIPNVYSENFPETWLGADPAFPSEKSTSVLKVNFGEVVEVVLQNNRTSFYDNHPIHLHGYNFYVLAQGYGSFPGAEKAGYNLVNPQMRNTLALVTGGWAVIRFKADNPGMWIMHCHLDMHLTIGLAMVFEVLNGPSPAVIPQPPPDYPKCLY